MSFNYRARPANWTRDVLTQSLNRSAAQIAPILEKAKSYLRSHPELRSFRTIEERSAADRAGDEIRAEFPHLFSDIPKDTLFDSIVGRGIISHCLAVFVESESHVGEKPKASSVAPSSQEQRTEIPIPLAGPFLHASPDTTHASFGPRRVAPQDLVLHISRHSSRANVLKATVADYLQSQAPYFENDAHPIRQLTRKIILDRLIEEEFADSSSDLLVGVQGHNDLFELMTDFRLQGHLSSGISEGFGYVVIYTARRGEIPLLDVGPVGALGRRPSQTSAPSIAPYVPLSQSSALSSKHARVASNESNTPKCPTLRPSVTKRMKSAGQAPATHGNNSAGESGNPIQITDPTSSEDEYDPKFGGDAGVPDNTEAAIQRGLSGFQKSINLSLSGVGMSHDEDPGHKVWAICSRLLGISVDARTTKAEIDLPGIRFKLNQYQFFAAVLFHLWGRDGKNGGFLADGPGIGKTLEGISILILEFLFQHNYYRVRQCQRSRDPEQRARHRDPEGNGECKGAPLFFAQCYCDKKSDLAKFFPPKQGFGIVFAPKSIMPVWRAAWEKFYEEGSSLSIRFIICHGEYGKGDFQLTPADIDALRGKYPEGIVPTNYQRLFHELPESHWKGKCSARSLSPPFILLTTPQSFETKLLKKLSYTYKWSPDPDPPASGLGSKKKPIWKWSTIPALTVSWALIDEFHIVKSEARGSGPWASIQDMYKSIRTLPSVVAISGTPFSTGPADIAGPISCLSQLQLLESATAGDQPLLNVEKLRGIARKFKNLVESPPGGATNNIMKSLVDDLGTRMTTNTLRRTEESLWGGAPILSLPPLDARQWSLKFPTKYHHPLIKLRAQVADRAQQAGKGTFEQNAYQYWKSMTRQELMIATIPWLIEFWEKARNADQRFLVADYAHWLDDSNYKWLNNHPLLYLRPRYENLEEIKKFAIVTDVCRRALISGDKVLIFSQFVLCASFAQDYIAHHPKLRMYSALWHTAMSADAKERLNRNFQDISSQDGGVQVLCGVQSAMGTGVDLFAANHVIFLEPFNSPAQKEQAYKRAHRRGATKTVFVYSIDCAANEGGILAEKIVLKRATARDMMVSGIFAKAKMQATGLTIEGDEEQEE